MPGFLESFQEKPDYMAHDKQVNVAVSIFEKRVIEEYCDSKDTSFFKESIARIQISEKICLHKIKEWFHVQDWNTLHRLQHEKKFIPSH